MITRKIEPKKKKKKVSKARGKSPIVPEVLEASEVLKAAADLFCCPECGKGCRTKLALLGHQKTHKK